jgi:purine-binding chemotaxis protein CheW
MKREPFDHSPWGTLDSLSRQEGILRERARVLSEKRRVPSDVEFSGYEGVEFQLGAERYAVETRFVEEFFLPDSILPIPCTPDFVLGVVSRRGRILSVLDLGAFLPGSLPRMENRERPPYLLVLRQEAMELAVAVEQVGSVCRFPHDRLASRSDAVPSVLLPYVLGVTPDSRIFLNAAALLEEPALIVND